MARTDEGAEATEKHRQRQLTLRSAMLKDLTDLWKAVDPEDLSGTIGTFTDASTVLVRDRGDKSAELAKRYVREFRNAEGVSGNFSFGKEEQAEKWMATNAMRGAALSGILNGRKAGFSTQAAAKNGLVKAAGQATSLVLGAGRSTILNAALNDSQAGRWQRITDGDPCAFCAMLAGRGAVYLKEGTADFEPHGHCGCQPEIAYDGSDVPERSQQFREQYDKAVRDAKNAGEFGRGTTNDALNAFRRARGG